MKPSTVPLEAKPLLRPAEVAELLSVSEATVYRLLRAGELRTVLVRSLRRVPRAAVDAYIAGRLQDAEALDEASRIVARTHRRVARS